MVCSNSKVAAMAVASIASVVTAMTTVLSGIIMTKF